MTDPCFSGKQKMLTVDEAIDYLIDQASPLTISESISTMTATGRVLAEPVIATVTVPPADNSAMDGYAIRVEDLLQSTILPVSQRIPAGATAEPLRAGTAARIFTGAPVPENADAVIMQERCVQDDQGNVTINHQPKAGENIRRAGEDIKPGTVILEKGARLRPQDIGLAASVGAATLDVFKKLRVAIFSTGDELVEPGDVLPAGKIYNSNRYTMTGMLERLGCDIIDLGTIEDTLDATMTALTQAAESADVIMTSGGVSVGEEDYIKAALEKLGNVSMWRVAMKPGKPVAYGRVAETPFIGLPGNPVSVFSTFCLFARPYLLKSMGISEGLTARPFPVTAGFDWLKSGPRREFIRVRLECDAKGGLIADYYPAQGSGILTSTVWADGLVMIPENTTVSKGDTVSYLSFNELLC
jgi:molybdopterin molybdotransferase